MTHLLDLLAVRGIRSVHLMVNTEFASAVRLYARFGFSEQRRFEDVMGDGNPGTLIEMHKVLP